MKTPLPPSTETTNKPTVSPDTLRDTPPPPHQTSAASPPGPGDLRSPLDVDFDEGRTRLVRLLASRQFDNWTGSYVVVTAEWCTFDLQVMDRAGAFPEGSLAFPLRGGSVLVARRPRTATAREWHHTGRVVEDLLRLGKAVDNLTQMVSPTLPPPPATLPAPGAAPGWHPLMVHDCLQRPEPPTSLTHPLCRDCKYRWDADITNGKLWCFLFTHGPESGICHQRQVGPSPHLARQLTPEDLPLRRRLELALKTRPMISPDWLRDLGLQVNDHFGAGSCARETSKALIAAADELDRLAKLVTTTAHLGIQSL